MTIKNNTKHPARLAGVLIPTIILIAMIIANIILTAKLDPYTNGWTECVLQLCFRLPVALAGCTLLRKTSNHETKASFDKKTFRRFATVYTLFVILPVHAVSPYMQLATATPVTSVESPFAWLLNRFLLAPVLEEIIFRGMLFGISRRFMGFKASALLNAILFAILHLGNPLTVIATALFAPLLCAMYEATGSLKYGMILHILFNSLAIPMVFLAPLVPFFISIPMAIIALTLQIFLVKNSNDLVKRMTAKVAKPA